MAVTAKRIARAIIKGADDPKLCEELSSRRVRQQPLPYEDLRRQGQAGDDLQYRGEDELPRGGAVDEPERTEDQAG